MKKQRQPYHAILGVAVVTGLLLLIPLVAMQFTEEVDWKVGDFIIAGALLFGTGTAYVVATISARPVLQRLAMALGLGSMLLLVWVNLAVGLIGGGAHAGNLMYIGVVLVGVIGIFRSRFRAAGMAEAMYAVTLAIVLVAGIALVTGMDRYTGSSMGEILGVNGFFAILFLVAGLLFRHVAQEGRAASAEG